MINSDELYEEIKIFVLVRDYFEKHNQKCINGINECVDCGCCWMTQDEIIMVAESFDL